MTSKKRPGRSPGNPAGKRIQEVSSTGIRVEANHKYHNKVEWQPGEHLWIAIGMWQIKDPANDQYMLDVENLMNIEGPGCYVCEEHYSPEVAAKPCEGDPSGIMEPA